ncbi:MAG: hypothetical protein WC128_00385 [Bacteroidales bacterium]|jgi:hypothetical protein
MSEKTLHNPHLKENPFKVPSGYFQQVEARWANGEVPDQVRSDPGKGRRFIRLLRPQLQLAAAFVMLFGIGYLLLLITGRNETRQMQTEELSVLSEWSSLGLDHRDVSNLILENLFEEDQMTPVVDPDVEDLIDYMDYPGFDPVNLALSTNNE